MTRTDTCGRAAHPRRPLPGPEDARGVRLQLRPLAEAGGGARLVAVGAGPRPRGSGPGADGLKPGSTEVIRARVSPSLLARRNRLIKRFLPRPSPPWTGRPVSSITLVKAPRLRGFRRSGRPRTPSLVARGDTGSQLSEPIRGATKAIERLLWMSSDASVWRPSYSTALASVRAPSEPRRGSRASQRPRIGRSPPVCPPACKPGRSVPVREPPAPRPHQHLGPRRPGTRSRR